MWPIYLRRETSLHPDSRNFIRISKRQTLVSVVAHELAHVQRRDMFLHLWSEIMLVPLAYHPFSYWLRSQLAEAREMACDALVSGPTLPPTDYARCLLDVAETLKDTESPLHALGISESATLEHRIQALVASSPLGLGKLSAWNRSRRPRRIRHHRDDGNLLWHS